MDGIININKPKGITSFDVIRSLRRSLKTRKIGHTGTLDPLATGVLVVCVGKATKLASVIEGQVKTYIASFDLGYKTTTYDSEGEIVEKSQVKPSRDEVEKALLNFKGKIKQVPPMYSAIKVDGKRLYELAREGKTIKRKERDVEVFNIELLSYEDNRGSILFTVSKGTYIRSLIYDLGELLGSYGTMTDLKRSDIGNHNIKDSVDLETLDNSEDPWSYITSIEDGFPYNKLNLSSSREVNLFNNGNTVVVPGDDGKFRIYFEDKFLGLGDRKRDRLKGYKYFNV